MFGKNGSCTKSSVFVLVAVISLKPNGCMCALVENVPACFFSS